MTTADPPHTRRALRRFHVLAMLLCAIVGLDTLGSVAANGSEGLTWPAVLGLLFFAPYGLLIVGLGCLLHALGTRHRRALVRASSTPASTSPSTPTLSG
ncbi:hypothetical protein OG948_01730 [Embleya sp. NBC_00888]|uniref:hypothetical protein n=1 Tax=Embleya sp. NBC_00888 TaxID=2975960 RepID=UPI00386F587E|nr:hypothetical protein OG948_01730 [Embleya sp. NBC_00888]